MKTYGLKVSKDIEAEAHVIYDVLSNYQEGHPRILPDKYFTDIKVIQGGIGSGTRIRVTTKFMGIQQQMEMEITEPSPGRVLQEEDHENGVITQFKVEPNEKLTSTRVTIETKWKMKSGIKGLLEKISIPIAAKKMYNEELDLLNDYCKELREKK